MPKEEKVYMPKDEALRVEIIRLHYDMPIEGHRGQWKMAEMVTRNFWWPGVMREVKRYVEGCDAVTPELKIPSKWRYKKTYGRILTKWDTL